jgi:hypothetical protein
MPRKPSPPKPESTVLSADEHRAAVSRLEQRIKDLRELDVSNLQAGDDPPVQDLGQRIKSMLASIYGEGSRQYARLRDAASLDATTYVMSFTFGDGGGGTSVHEIRQGVDRGRNRAISILLGEVDALKEGLQFLSPAPAQTIEPAMQAEPSDEIFIVHGRDEAAKEAAPG